MRQGAVLALLCAACSSRPEVPIINWHALGVAGDEFSISEFTFNKQIELLVREGFQSVALHDLVEHRLSGLPLPARPVVLTFDDGTEDALKRVLPALKKRGMRGTFFIATGFLGKPGYLDWDGVRALSDAGMEIGSHSVSHARLTEASDEQLREELVRSKQALEEHLGRTIEVFAYPYNAVRPGVREAAARAGYRAAVAGAVHGGADLLDLYRVSVKSNMTLDDFRRQVQR